MYDNKHRYFVQYMLRNGCIITDKAIHIANKIYADEEETFNLSVLKDFVDEINRKIRKTDLRLTFLQCEVTGINHLMLINMAKDEVSKAQEMYTPSALEYFYSLMMEIVTGDSRNVAQNTALNLASHLTKRLSRQDAQDLLFKWKKDGYLVLKGGKVYLGPRCINEYMPFFRQECKDYVRICDLCSELVFIGSSCLLCEQLMHKHCLDKFLSKQSLCPCCNKNWVHADADLTQNNESTVPDRIDDSSSSDDGIAPPSKKKAT